MIMRQWLLIAAITLQISDAVGNEYGKPRDLAGETRMAFTSHADSAFDVCFENQLVTHRKPCLSRTQYHVQFVFMFPRVRHEPYPSHRT